MKRLNWLILLVLLNSCNSNKALIDYAKSEINKTNPERIYVFSYKTNVNYSIENLKKPFNNMTSSRSKVFNFNEYLEFKNKYKNDTLKEQWVKKDFSKIKAQIIENDIQELKNNNPKEVFSGNRLFFTFSKPLFIKTRKEIMFYVSKGSNFGSPIFSGIITMRKINEKWEKIEEIEAKELH